MNPIDHSLDLIGRNANKRNNVVMLDDHARALVDEWNSFIKIKVCLGEYVSYNSVNEDTPVEPDSTRY